MHIAWSRIDQDTMTARPLPYFKFRLKEVSRELEIKLNLTRVRNEVEGPIKYAPTRAEEEQARRLGVDIRKTRQAIRDCYDRSDCGRSFEAALAHEGLILAQGEKRDFLVIDHAGGMHALGKRILGVTAREIRERLSDLDRQHLPTVEQARAHIAEPADPGSSGSRSRCGTATAITANGTTPSERPQSKRRRSTAGLSSRSPRKREGRAVGKNIGRLLPPRPEPIPTSPPLSFRGHGERDNPRSAAAAADARKTGGQSDNLGAWHQSDNNSAFAAALDGQGILLAV